MIETMAWAFTFGLLCPTTWRTGYELGGRLYDWRHCG